MEVGLKTGPLRDLKCCVLPPKKYIRQLANAVHLMA